MKSGQSEEIVMPVSEFKAKCLEVLGKLGSRKLTHVTVTRHGRPVAELFPPRSAETDVIALFSSMAGTVIVPEGVDLTATVIDMNGWNADPVAAAGS